MNESEALFWKLFYKVYEELPRQGPGNNDCAARALSLCSELPQFPQILDLGCGVGGQTFHLAELTSGRIMAIDSHAASIEKFREALIQRKLTHRVQAQVGDIAHLQHPPDSFDLIWSEGALYNIGISRALRICLGLLRAGGYLAFSDAIWRKENPPPEVQKSFLEDYPDMGGVDAIIAKIRDGGFQLVGHFTLPDEAWWADFYSPMLARIADLRTAYSQDSAALAVLDQLAEEPQMHRQYSDFYAYEFFVVRRPPATQEINYGISHAK